MSLPDTSLVVEQVQNDVISQSELPSFTYFIDPITNKMIGNCDGLEAVKQNFNFLIQTPLGSGDCHLTDWGVDFNDLINKPVDYIIAESINRIKNALEDDSRYLDISFNPDKNFEIIDNDSIVLHFIVTTIYGEFNTSMEVQR